MSNAAPRNIHQDITNQIIAAIEANPGKPSLPWRMTGGNPMPVNTLSGKHYNGINILSLWVAAQVRGFGVPVWGTYRQWQEKGCQVRRGEKSSLVVFYKEFETDPEDEDDDGRRRMARASFVFNADQVDGWTPPELQTSLGPVERMARADSFATATGANIRHGGNRAYFDGRTDHIQMPDEGLFTGTQTMIRSEGLSNGLQC